MATDNVQKLAEYVKKGRFLKVKELTEKMIKKGGKDGYLYANLGLALCGLDRNEEALKHLLYADKLGPTASNLNNLGNCYTRLGKPVDAIKAFKKCVAIDDNVQYLDNFASAYITAGMPSKAVLLYKSIVLKGKATGEMYKSLVEQLINLSRYNEALELIEYIRDEIEAALLKAQIYVDLMQFENADSLVTFLNAKDNLLDEQKVKLFSLCNYLGRFSDASLISSSIKNRSLPSVVSHDIDTGKMSPARFESYIKTKGFNSQLNPARAKILYSMANAYKKSNYAEYFKFLCKANNTLYDNYDHQSVVRLFEKIRTEFESIKFDSTDIKQSRLKIVFIVGMPRSGTTLSENILGCIDKVKAVGESALIFQCLNELIDEESYDESSPHSKKLSYLNVINKLSQSELVRLRERIIKRYREFVIDENVVIDKMPHNFIHLGIIQKLLPEAKFVYAKRNAIDVTSSIFEQCFSAFHSYSKDLISLGLYYNEFLKLMSFWQDKLDNKSIYVLEYEKLVNSPINESKMLIDFVGLKWDERCLEFFKGNKIVKTASNNQVREGIYTKSVNRLGDKQRFYEDLVNILNMD